MKQLNVDENIAKSVNRKVAKLVIITTVVIITTIYANDSMFDDQNSQLLQNLEAMYTTIAMVAYQLMKNILSLICRCFIISICDLISAELDKMEKKIKEANSPYEAMKLIKSSIIKYEQLQELSKSTNVLFSGLLFTGFITSIMPVAYIIAYVLSSNHNRWKPLYLSVDYFLFALSLTALYSASQVNSKVNFNIQWEKKFNNDFINCQKRNLTSAIRNHVVNHNPLDTVEVMKFTIN
ncbi:hypothetical protein CHUAL_012161 [Chamberlinius hualienensis]